MVVVRVDLRHISDEKKLSYSDVLWQYVKQDFLWRINNAGLGKVLWLQKPYFATGEKLAFYYVYGSPGGRAEDNGTSFDVLRNIIIGNAGLNSHSDVVWTNAELSKQTAKVSANEPDTSDMQPLIHTWNLSAMCDGGEVPFAVRLERINEADAGVPMTKNIVFMNSFYGDADVCIFSPESRLGEQLFEIMDKLELVSDMKPYGDAYEILKRYSVSGRQIIDIFKVRAKNKPKTVSMHRLEQVYGYRSYTYMRRRWERYCKRLTRQQRAYANAGWEETLDLILDFLTPVWSAFCNDEIFYDDWMPELGRFLG